MTATAAAGDQTWGGSIGGVGGFSDDSPVGVHRCGRDVEVSYPVAREPLGAALWESPRAAVEKSS